MDKHPQVAEKSGSPTDDAVCVGAIRIGAGHPCYVIAEAGVNHNGNLDLAKELVDAAAAAGANAVKFQTFNADKIISAKAPKADYQRTNTGRGGSQLDMVRNLQLDEQAHYDLLAYCKQRNIQFLSSAFDEQSVDLLCEMGVPALKIGSGELTNNILLAHMAQKGAPLLLSTGMGTLDEVADALACIAGNGAPPVVLFHCVSNYPASPSHCNLNAMQTMRRAFGVPVGWSDHTLGQHVMLAAVAMGADIVEKHLTLDRDLPGPDHRASMEPDEFTDMVDMIRDVEMSLGNGEKCPAESEHNTIEVARRSLHAACNIMPGHLIAHSDLIAMRPGTGIAPNRLEDIVGRSVNREIAAGTIIEEKDIA